MSNYKLIGLTYGDSRTCEHCGRTIKNIAILENTVTGEKMEVGTTCLGKVLNLNEKFDKAVQTEIKKYKAYVDKYNETRDYQTNYNRMVESGSLQQYNPDNRNEDGSLRFYTEKQVMKSAKMLVWTGVADLIKATKRLNELSKKGYIQLMNLAELEKEEKEIKKNLIDTM